jgi:predicted deacylase
MQIDRFGEGDPAVAVVGGIHGDEPCGVTAVEHFVAQRPAVERPVAFVVANEEAVSAGTRGVDADLNRSFPGDSDSEKHEERLAARLTAVLGDCEVLSLHSTQSSARPFAIVNGLGAFERRVCPGLPVEAVVDAGRFDAGRIFASCPRTVEVECGLQGSEQAANNAVEITRAFLQTTGVLPGPGPTPTEPLPVFELERAVEKHVADEYEVFAENFEPVREGDRFAAIDGEALRAAEDFYPVLMSAEGYEDQFGYTARKVGRLA